MEIIVASGQTLREVLKDKSGRFLIANPIHLASLSDRYVVRQFNGIQIFWEILYPPECASLYNADGNQTYRFDNLAEPEI